MRKFRVGDVVSGYGSSEGRVSYVREDGGALIAQTDSRSSVSGPASGFTLLRRPVRVGDVIVQTREPNALAIAVDKITPTMDYLDRPTVCFEGVSNGRMARDAWDYAPNTSWTHADGTPIDPPQAATQGAGTMMEAAPPYGHKACCWCDDCERWRASIPTPPPMPTVEQLARAIWRTDRRVIAFCASVDDAVAPPQPADADWAKVGEEVVRRHERALDIAWTRDEHGWATEAQQRAEQILDVLRGGGR